MRVVVFRQSAALILIAHRLLMRLSQAGLALFRRERQGRCEFLAQWNGAWGCFHLVGGHKHEGETFRDCVAREVTEELGLLSGVDFYLAGTPLRRAQYTAWSARAGELTEYIAELYAADIITDAALQQIEADAMNRWLGTDEIRSGRLAVGEPISATMNFLLTEAALFNRTSARASVATSPRSAEHGRSSST